MRDVGGRARAPSTSGGAAARRWPHDGGEQEPIGSARAVRLGLLVALLILLPIGNPHPGQVALALILALVLFVSVRWRLGAVAVVALFLAGLTLRFVFFRTGFSGVLDTTDAAIAAVASGRNPYGIGYQIPAAPGQPFPYGPLALLWYLPARGAPRLLEFSVSLLILAALTVRGRPLGLAVYAVLPQLVTTASDGANDTSAGLLLLVALLVAVRAPIWGGVLLAVAVAFKPYAAAWLPPLVAWAGAAPLVGFVAGFAVTWGPALLAWGPASILTSLRLAEQVHPKSYYSLAVVLEAVTGRTLAPELFDRLRLVLGGVAAAASWFAVRRWSGRSSGNAMIVAGVFIYLVTLYTAYWSTFAYVAAIAPIICWRLDEWLGIEHDRVQWPGDPVGRLETFVDQRWPVRGQAAGS